MLILAHCVSFSMHLKPSIKRQKWDGNWQLTSHWISYFESIRFSLIMQMRSFGTFLGIIVMVGMGFTDIKSWISNWRYLNPCLGVFIATMDTHWQISVPDPGHRQVFYYYIERNYQKYRRVASLNCTKGYGNIVKVILDSLRNAVDTVTPIWNRFWFRSFLNSTSFSECCGNKNHKRHYTVNAE